MSSEQSNTKRSCGISSFLPLGMSCRDRAEAFARSLQSRLKTLGTQGAPPGITTVTEPASENSCLIQPTINAEITNPVTGLPDTESFFDFDNEPESPASPAEENVYFRLVESESNKLTNGNKSLRDFYTPASTPRTSSGESHTSSDEPFYDPESPESDQRSSSLSLDYYDCVDSKSKEYENGYAYPLFDSDSCSESLPQSQSTTTSLSTFTGFSSASNNTLQDEAIPDVFMPREQYDENNSTDDNDVDATKDSRSSKFEYMKELILDFPKLSTLPDETTIDNETNETVPTTEHLVVLMKDVDNPKRIRRSSSLKTGKTPPGTPGRKKFVRFADVLGLDLADIKTYLDEIPIVPRSAYADLNLSDPFDDPIMLERMVDRILMPLFQQPGGMPGFLDLVRERKVCLENAAVTDPICMTITGSIRVRNLDFNKSVHLRYTLDGWQSFSDFQANYIENSCDGFSDKFSFTIFGNSLQIGQRLEMAVRFSCKGEQFWDSNFGVNYCFQCFPSTTLLKSSSSSTSTSEAVIPDERAWSGTFY